VFPLRYTSNKLINYHSFDQINLFS
jgi:hypothetical protein